MEGKTSTSPVGSGELVELRVTTLTKIYLNTKARDKEEKEKRRDRDKDSDREEKRQKRQR